VSIVLGPFLGCWTRAVPGASRPFGWFCHGAARHAHGHVGPKPLKFRQQDAGVRATRGSFIVPTPCSA